MHMRSSQLRYEQPTMNALIVDYLWFAMQKFAGTLGYLQFWGRAGKVGMRKKCSKGKKKDSCPNKKIDTNQEDVTIFTARS